MRALDDVLWPEPSRQLSPPPMVAVLKLDVEGYECKALHGAALLLRERAIRAVKTEVFDYGLKRQGCSGVQLQRLLADAGFRLYRRDPGANPLDRPIDPNALWETQLGLPYNLYGVQTQPYPRPDWSRRRRGRRLERG